MKSILICLEKLGIGGVETSVINQALEYKRRGINVIIVAQDGIYSELLRKNEITIENFEFKLENSFQMEDVIKIKDIIKKYNIEEVIINQFPCILSVMIACFETNIPYIAYLHTATKSLKDDEYNVFDWYENKFEIYKYIFKLYFNNAQKIIAISDVAAEYAKKRYNIPIEKFVTIRNSINLDLYKSSNNENKREKFLIISRFSNEKLQSIKNGIDIFNAYDNKEKTLEIVGDGECKEKIKEYIGDNSKITLLGQKNDIKEIIDENDIVLGLDRTILEAIAMKKIAVIVGYEKVKQIICKENIEIEANEGFSGNSLEDNSIETIAKEIKCKKIDVESNYQFLKDNLNIENNIYIEKDFKVDYNLGNLFEIIQKILNDKIIEEEENKKIISKLTNENEQIFKKSNELKEQLESIQNSKRFRLINNLAKFMNK